MTEHDLLEVVEIEEACGLSLWGWDGYRAELDRPEAVMLVARRPAPGRLDGRALCGFIAARVQGEELHVNTLLAQVVELRGSDLHLTVGLPPCARIDGATRFGAMWRIAFPLATPGILSAGIFAFTLSWNEFIYALTFVTASSQRTIRSAARPSP